MPVVSISWRKLNWFFTMLQGPSVATETDKRNASHCRECACGRLCVGSGDKYKDVLIKKRWGWNKCDYEAYDLYNNNQLHLMLSKVKNKFTGVTGKLVWSALPDTVKRLTIFCDNRVQLLFYHFTIFFYMLITLWQPRETICHFFAQ